MEQGHSKIEEGETFPVLEFVLFKYCDILSEGKQELHICPPRLSLRTGKRMAIALSLKLLSLWKFGSCCQIIDRTFSPGNFIIHTGMIL